MRRKNYESILGEQEYFTTPLLSNSIKSALTQIGEPKPGARVLDIGAGECPLRPTLEEMGYEYCSLDIEQNRGGTINFVTRIDGVLPEQLESAGGFDLLILTEVLEHVPDWEIAFSNLVKLLKTGGHCIITTPFFYMLHEEPYDFWRPTDHALRFFAEKHGMEVTYSRRNGDGWDVLGTMVCSTSVCRKQKSIAAYLAALPVWVGHKILKYFFKKRTLQCLVDLQMRYYLSNFIILQKS